MITIILTALCAIQGYSQESIVYRYKLNGGKGAQTSMVLIGGIMNHLPINYYLSCNVTSQGELWMLHIIPWTEYKIEFPYKAKVLIRDFNNNILELSASTTDDGNEITSVTCDNQSYNRYISGVHCKLSQSQLEQLINRGIRKIRIQSNIPKGFVEREYDNMSVASTLSRAYHVLKEEFKPIDIYVGF